MRNRKIVLAFGMSAFLILLAGIFFIKEDTQKEIKKQETGSNFSDESEADETGGNKENLEDIPVSGFTDGGVSEKSNMGKVAESSGQQENLRGEKENQDSQTGDDKPDTSKNAGEPEPSEPSENEDKKKNEKTTYQYDKLGRLILEEHEEYCIYYTYDSNGNITKIENHSR